RELPQRQLSAGDRRRRRVADPRRILFGRDHPDRRAAVMAYADCSEVGDFAEEEATHAALAAIGEHLCAGMLILDPSLTVTFANKAARDILAARGVRASVGAR